MKSNPQEPLRRLGWALLLLALSTLPLGYAASQQWLPGSLSSDPMGYPAMGILFLTMSGFALLGKRRGSYVN